MDANRHWVLWDGDCGLCRAAADWVRRRDRGGRLAVAAWQRAPSPPMTEALAAACRQAVQVVTRDGTVLAGAEAVAFVLGEVGWPRWARLLTRPPLRWVLRQAYAWLARHRGALSRLLGLPAACQLEEGRENVKQGT